MRSVLKLKLTHEGMQALSPKIAGARMIKGWLLLMGFAFLGGCGSSSIKAQAGSLTQDQADAISAKCGASKEMLAVRNGELTLAQAQNFEVTNCMMKSLDKAGITNFAGLTGNEMYQAPDK
ncbi:hypothetical protein ASE85_07800 [Sphingobium sp. Leaf26]|uniref:hypothetical protein n=1 Tax=Sphingobium sp. Leaf26 TaxID=1735693 RepID=UPI0006F6F40C|nr:hypothetical protein [Sphingobium sp. Leaf26]KQN04880.1 hypothetical protein ASE85_07800 [Sphingobium sp. Leaf26]